MLWSLITWDCLLLFDEIELYQICHLDLLSLFDVNSSKFWCFKTTCHLELSQTQMLHYTTMVRNGHISSAFLLSAPKGWKPRTPYSHYTSLFAALTELDKEDKQQAKKNSHTTPTSRSLTSSWRGLLMSPDDFNIHQQSNSISWEFFPQLKQIGKKSPTPLNNNYSLSLKNN